MWGISDLDVIDTQKYDFISYLNLFKPNSALFRYVK